MSKEKFDKSKPHVNIGTTSGEDTANETVVNLSEKMEEIRAVEAEEAMKGIYGEDKIKPVSEEQSNAMSSWGYKKRWRFAELLELGKDNLEAYDIVENHQGKCD